MSLNKEEKRELSILLSTIRLDVVTDFPITNVLNVPTEYASYEVVYRTKNKLHGFTLDEAIKQSGHPETVAILDTNGMHYYYTQNRPKQMLWMPSIYDTVKNTEGTVIVMQDFPSDGQCRTKHAMAKDIEDSALDDFRDKDVVIFNNANFFLDRGTLKRLSDEADALWKKSLLSNNSGLSTLHANNIT